MFDAGWTDGLPTVPPTRELVNRFVAATHRGPGERIALLAPAGGQATVERVAANAVMAGCRPEYMPVIIAALEAMVEESFNLNGMQCSTHMASPLMIVHGPIRKALGINCAGNAFGQGWRANATIGRAVKLALVNIGGATPPDVDKATFGQPGKFTFCVGEIEEASPWEPLHVERGFRATDSAVTVYGAEGLHNINNQMVNSPFDLLTTIASSMATLGSNHAYLMGESFVVLSPEHADVCANAGWKKSDVKQFLFERARLPQGLLKLGGIYGPETGKYDFWPRWVNRSHDDTLVPVARRAEDISIVVVGGAGRHSAYVPGWATRSVTRKIQC
jgi:hypothetical protein